MAGMQQLDDNKAGMTDLDKDKINRIISENTGANYASFSKKKQERIDNKVALIKKKLNTATPEEWSRAQKQMDNMTALLLTSQDMSHDCVHIDMDAYFAAVEMRDDVHLRTVPMAVGTMAMLSTSNYLARRFGVRAGMPGFIGKKLCPNLTIVDGNYDKYTKESRVFSAIFASYDPEMSMGSLDEAYIDITDHVATRMSERIHQRKRYGGSCECRLPIISPNEIDENMAKSENICTKCNKQSIVYEDTVTFGLGRSEVVKEIRFLVEQATGLTCSAGIAANFMLAKICSDFNKPNGQYELANDDFAIAEFLRDLPIRKVAGIGRVSEAFLKACDINTVGDLSTKSAALTFAFSPLSQEMFLRIGLGLPAKQSAGGSKRKSLSVERTFQPTNDTDFLLNHLKLLCDMLITDCEGTGVEGGRTVTIKIKLSTFEVLTRCRTLEHVVSKSAELYEVASDIFNKELAGQEIRLLGVRLSFLEFAKGEEAQTNSRKTVLDYWNDVKRKRCEEATASTIDVGGEASTSQQAETVSCPVCNEAISNDDRKINAHVDACLKLQSANSQPTTKLRNPPKKSTLDTFFVRGAKKVNKIIVE